MYSDRKRSLSNNSREKLRRSSTSGGSYVCPCIEVTMGRAITLVTLDPDAMPPADSDAAEYIDALKTKPYLVWY